MVLSDIRLEPVDRPQRRTEQRFLAVVMPLDRGAAAPAIAGNRVTHPGGAVDEITLSPDGSLRVMCRQGERTLASFSSAQPSAGPNRLRTNSDVNARQLAAGLKPVLDRLAAERDRYRDRTNLARTASVTASATRDARFPPSKVIDNETAEYPTDGHLDYGLGTVWSSNRTAGYGRGRDSLLVNRDYFPLYVRPTYWLLPEATLGHVELTLKRPATVDLVRLLNTSNAGLNDFATHIFRVELRDAQGHILASKDGAFGKVFDRPFAQAFVVPRWFDHYTPTFAGMLEPGQTVPFGDGWQEVAFPAVKDVAAVRVVVTKYWGIGGGLNEVQVFGR